MALRPPLLQCRSGQLGDADFAEKEIGGRIVGLEDDRAGFPDQYSGGPCFVGVDIAARNDLFVIYVLEAVGDVFWTREIIARKRISFAEQDELLADVILPPATSGAVSTYRKLLERIYTDVREGESHTLAANVGF